MRSRSLRLSGLLVAAATLLSTVFAGSASAGTTNAGSGAANAHHPSSRLFLMVKSPDGARSAVRLDCQPAGGSHPRAKRACLEIRVARGNFNHLPGSPELTACTMEFRPVAAVVIGKWRGDWVRWHHRYPNPCAMLSDTGVVFDF